MNNILQLIDPINLGNIGYKKYQFCDKRILPTCGVNVMRLPSPSLEKPYNITPCIYQSPNKIIAPQPDIVKQFNEYDIHYYPAPYNHAAEFPDLKILNQL